MGRMIIYIEDLETEEIKYYLKYRNEFPIVYYSDVEPHDVMCCLHQMIAEHKGLDLS